jgi:hypothetical protein
MEISLRKYETLSPFEVKDELIKIARRTTSLSNLAFLNAGRGNPNWIATKPREAFFLLGQFAITESRRVMDLPAGVGGMPQAPGIAARLDAWLASHTDSPGATFLATMVHSQSTNSASRRMRSSMNWWTASSVTTTRCPTGCWCTTSVSSMNT